MSDSRREIAERWAKTLLTSAKPDFMLLEAAMAEYAAAVLEEMANDMWMLADKNEAATLEQAGGIRIVAQRVEARATQERER